jgi:uncharacterized membrane protein
MAQKTVNREVLGALLISNLVTVVLFLLRVIVTKDTRYWFLFWNLLLAWVPVLLAWLLVSQLAKRRWSDPVPLLLTVLWLAFLPNSFYLMSDLIHLKNTGEIGLLYDAVLFLSCIWNGAVAGMLSIYWVHQALLKRRTARFATGIVASIFLLTSIAIYLGRNLRWNTWDILANPAGLLFDVSERIINPLAHPQIFVTSLTFFILLSSMYYVIWAFVRTLQTKLRC